MNPEALINGIPYPIAVDKEGLRWRVADTRALPPRTWSDWSGGMGEAEEKSGRGYYFSDGFDATVDGQLRLAPTINSLVSSGLSTDHGYFFEALGASAAPTYDSSVSGDTAGTAASTLTLSSLTVASGNLNRIVVVFVSVAGATSGDTMSFCQTVTFAGQQCTYLTKKSRTGVSTEAWYLLDPPEGAQATVITLRSSTGDQHIAAAAASFYGVNQSSPFTTYKGTSGSAGTAQLQLSGVASTDTIVAGVGIGASLTVTAGTNETERWDNNDGANITNSGYTQAGSDGGLIAPTFTSNPYAIVGIALAAGTKTYHYCAEGARVWKLEYDPDAGITEIVIESGTADSATSTTLTDTGAFAGNTFAQAAGRNIVKITGGTGSGQYRAISSHTDDALTVAAWDTTPDGTSTYAILASIDITSAVMGQPFFYYSKWYVPCGASVDARRLDTVAAGQDTWTAVTNLRALHFEGFQKGNTPHIAGATTANQIGTEDSAPTAALVSLGAGVGDTSTTITGLVETMGFLYTTKEDGLYELDTNGVARPVDLGLSRSNVDNQNGRTPAALGDMVFYPTANGLLRYQIGSGTIPIGLESLRGFRRVVNTGISPPIDRRPVGVVVVGKYIYTVYNDTTKSLICQGRLRGQGDPDGPEWLWHSFRDVSLVKGLGPDSRNRLWMKGADPDSDKRAFQVMELDAHGGTNTQYRRGAASEIYTIYFDEWTPDGGENVQLRTFEVENSVAYTGGSLQLQVYRDSGASAEDVGSAIVSTGGGVTIRNWTVGTTDTAYSARPVLELTTGSTYKPLSTDAPIFRARIKARTPMVYECVIEAKESSGMTAEDIRQNLYRLQNQGVISVNEPGTDGPSPTSFLAEVVRVADIRYETPRGVASGIELILQRWIMD